MTAEHRSICLYNLRNMADAVSSTMQHKDLTKSRITKDEKSVKSIYNLIGPVWTNPFSGNADLSSLSTGKVLHPQFRSDLLDTYAKGLEA